MAPAAQRPVLAPVSPGQARLYFLDRLLARRETYNTHLAARIGAALDPELLRQALEGLVARHEQLRVHFVEREGVPSQRILPWVDPPVHCTCSP